MQPGADIRTDGRTRATRAARLAASALLLAATAAVATAATPGPPGSRAAPRASTEQVAGAIRSLVAADRGLRRACGRAFRSGITAVYCDPDHSGAARLRVTHRTARRAGAVIRVAGAPLTAPRTVAVIAAPAGARAQLAVVVRDGDVLLYARFGRFGRRRLAGAVRVRRTAAGVQLRLDAGGRSRPPLVRRAVRLRLPVPAPVSATMPAPVPAATAEPSPAVPPSLAIRECGPLTPSAASPAADFERFWGAERTGPGWTGGDVTFSVPVSGGRIVWIFGDTFVGHVAPDGRRTGGLVSNALAVQEGGCITTLVRGTAQAPVALLSPADPSEWYWPADATWDAGLERLQVLLWRMRRTGPGQWDYAFAGTDLATFAGSEPMLGSIRPLSLGADVMWGAAVLERPEATYVYGTGFADGHALRVARAAGPGLDGAWEFATSTGWSRDPTDAAVRADGLSTQISVLPTGDDYLLVSQAARLGTDVLVRRAGAPDGPWPSGGDVLATAPAPQDGAFSYNAVVHPEFADARSILLSYNVNAIDPAHVMADAAIYRPRFVRVPWPPALPPQ